ncbi:MAG: hypothetical protein M3Q47_10035 [Actinomycetota bacterium]|nr:hypothetical protein [Actinomycetota bacterium]
MRVDEGGEVVGRVARLDVQHCVLQPLGHVRGVDAPGRGEHRTEPLLAEQHQIPSLVRYRASVAPSV